MFCHNSCDFGYISSAGIRTQSIGNRFHADHILYTCQALGIFLPLITTNCAVLGVALTVVTKEFTFGGEPHMLNLAESIVYAFATSVGFGLSMVLFAGLREQLSMNDVPKPFKGIPIALVTASIMAMAFMGFSGIVK